MNINENFDVMYKFEQQLQEAEDKFIYKVISPFCETIVEKKIDKKELEKILRRGMQPSITIDRLKAFRNEVMNMNSVAIIQRLDKLIEEGEGGNNE